MSVISMKQLLEAGVHFGHQTRRWNPKMAPYIYTERNGIYIIDLQKSVGKVDEAYKANMNIPYWPYMGTANKIVMTWDGNGGILNISFLITDNHDGTFTLSQVESSEETLALKSSKNSYWKATETDSKTTLLSEYELNKTTVDSVASSIDMSKSAETFTYLPVDQDTMPANDTDEDDTDDISDDEY